MNTKEIESATKKTVIWFSLFNYPLTVTELWQWLWSSEKISYREINDYVGSGKVYQVAPFILLKGEEENLEIRAERYLHAVRKQRKAKRATWWLSWMPWVEGVALCNSLGYQNARDESDIDFFIITKPNSVWLTRLLAVAMLKILGQRPSEEHGRDTLCLSFYITSDNLSLEEIILPNGDPYLTYWITQLNPLFGRGPVWAQFFGANEWVKKFLPNALGYARKNTNWYFRQGRETRPVGKMVKRLNAWAKALQIEKFSKKLFDQANKPEGNVIMTDEMLKLHTKDRRAYYKEAWKKKYEQA
jgi:hypothetical protein